MTSIHNKNQTYYKLAIEGTSADVDIWLGDDEGHPVKHADGRLDIRLIPGKYVVEFGLGSQCYPIELDKDTHFSQKEIVKGPKCERPIPKFDN